MNPLLILAAAEPESANVIQEISRTFGLNAPHFFAQVVSFSLVAFLLHRFAYKPILRTLEERRERIADALDNAEKIKAELAKTETARQEILFRASTEANKLIDEARTAAARVQEQETQKAVAAAEQLIAKAREAAQADHARMLADLKREIGQLVVRTTAQVAGKVLTDEDQRRLVDETNKQLAA
jgi:F-type H+-transporting ATPase subunit b